MQLTNDWSAISTTYSRPELVDSYRSPVFKVINNVCVLTGVIHLQSNTKGLLPRTISTLPHNCRPMRRVVFAVTQHAKSAVVMVLPSGRMVYYGAQRGAPWLSLDGVRFAVDPVLSMRGAAVVLSQNLRHQVGGLVSDMKTRKQGQLAVPVLQDEHALTAAIEQITGWEFGNATAKLEKQAYKNALRVMQKQQDQEAAEDNVVLQYGAPSSELLSLEPSVAPYGPPFNAPSVAVVGSLCMLSGALRVSRGIHKGNEPVAQLPSSCRPSWPCELVGPYVAGASCLAKDCIIQPAALYSCVS